MGKSAYIYLVEKSTKQEITLEDVKELVSYYQEITTKTGDLVNFPYGSHAFPYDIEEHDDENGRYLLLRSHDDQDDYRYLLIGVDSITKKVDDEIKTTHFIQITLPEGATPGDKGKGNELCKFFANKLEGELHLFNERVKYYYKR